ncbi:alpha-L-fucosidase [Pelagicoccus sp. SDUM812005]|uniref:alpha-L-fucosidase n=1 Tax=Pelagicoccus sp. SDUM812005 TaxID=3041257 RepID=UPI00280D50E7|nr:alpha-L-fucosidase [Pelagicoccus sp. SDUM812005]MDQ8183093.1 alpha-L-fucosidase [Pelagicoccus sp. SDUM812005]
MKKYLFSRFTKTAVVALACGLGLAASSVAKESSMDEMWGDTSTVDLGVNGDRIALFRDGNYGMFIHWGLYSSLAGEWKGKTYYGIGEWIMHPRVAGIPPQEYMEVAKEFNPSEFDAMEIARLAKDAGMKWIIITSKHHEGFAMFDSEHPFNIVDASPFGRDPMKELADACRELGLGFGFYYSHNQDWTHPGGNGGPNENADGSDASFDQYFVEKCFPQVKEICENYGPLSYIWFDTPGKMPKKHVAQLAEYVRRVQPQALLCSRVGHGMGDYASNGDMSVPPKNVAGLWESCDTTNDSWSYAWYDQNWKDGRQILGRLISTVARGGTYLLNVGPDGKGRVPDQAAKYLREAGEWIQRYPEVVYAADASPWGRALPWGDVTVQGDTLNLAVFDWPQDGRLLLPGLKNEVKSAKVLVSGKEVPVKVKRRGAWTELRVPLEKPDALVSVIRLRVRGELDVDSTHGIHPNVATRLLADFAEVSKAKAEEIRWMEKFGEWKHAYQVSDWKEGGFAEWTVDVQEAGFYHVELNYKGDSRLVWKVETEEGSWIQNQQNASHVYHTFPMGQLEFKKPGKRKIRVSLVEGDPAKSSLQFVSVAPVN